MLRSLTELGRRAYTCSCLVQNAVRTPRATLHTGRPLWAASTEAGTQESLAEDTEGIDVEKGLAGINISGITIPSKDTNSCLVDGVPYSDLPVIHIKASKNNTIMSLVESNGTKVMTASCGTEGFQNAKQKTTVAAQATGLALGQRALKKGVTNVKVMVKGLGQGRLASIKGLQMAGMNVISITDNTYWGFHTYRPRRPPSK